MRRLKWFVVLLATVNLMQMGGNSASEEEPPLFRITTKRDKDRVEVVIEKQTTIFAIHSPAGIGEAVIERTQVKWPAEMILRLHLKGLESLQVANGKTTLHAAVSSHDEKRRIRVWKDGKEDTPLDSTSPSWLEIRLIDRDGKPAKSIPLEAGFFEVRLPQAFFAEDPKSITVNWIDFYRN